MFKQLEIELKAILEACQQAQVPVFVIEGNPRSFGLPTIQLLREPQKSPTLN